MYSLTKSSFKSTSSRSAIFNIHARSGWEEFVHHLLTVEGLTPSCSASHLLVRFFSTRTNLILFTSSIQLCFYATKIMKNFHFLPNVLDFSLKSCFLRAPALKPYGDFLKVNKNRSHFIQIKIISTNKVVPKIMARLSNH